MDPSYAVSLRNLVAAACGSFLLLAFFAASAMAAPRSELWPRWSVHDPASNAVIDHADWTRLLRLYTRASNDGVVRFDYAGLAARDRAALDAYVARLAALPVSTLNRG